MVAHHQHVEVLLQRVARVGARWVGAAGQHIGLPADANDVGGVAAAGPFGVEGVDGAAGDGADRVLHEAGLIEGVGVDAHLHVELIGHREAAIDRRRGGAPVLVQLKAAGPGADLFLQGGRGAGVALAEEAQVHRQPLGGLEHAGQVEGAGGAGGGVGAGGRAGAAAQQGGDATGQGRFDLLGADEMDVGVDGAGGDDVALAGNRLGARAHDDVDPIGDVGVARLADRTDTAVAQADVGLNNAPPIEDQGIGDHRVHGPIGAAGLGLAHAIADHLAAAELHLIAVAGEVLLHLEDQLGVRQAQPVAGGGAVGLGVGAAVNPVGHGLGCRKGKGAERRRQEGDGPGWASSGRLQLGARGPNPGAR